MTTPTPTRLVPSALQAFRERIALGSATQSRARWPASFIVGLVLLMLFVFLAGLGALWTPHDPRASDAGPSFTAPSVDHWFGTDRLGRDVFSQVLAATALDLSIVASSVVLCFMIGTTIGTLAGFFQGLVDVVVMRLVEIVQSFPSLLLALMVAIVTGAGFFNIVAVLVFVGTPNFIRLARAELLTKSSMQYADAARLAGANRLQVAFGHLLPNSIGPLVAYCSINAAWAVLIVSSLGFLGVGVPPGTPEWGAIIAQGRTAIVSGQWWISLFPGLAIVALAATFYLLADGVSDILDPRRRRSHK